MSLAPVNEYPSEIFHHRMVKFHVSDIIANARLKLQFQIDVPQSTVTNLSFPDKAARKEHMIELRK